MLAFVFPGQGTQYVGMGEEFYRHYPLAKEVYEEASDVLKEDMARLCFDSDMETLSMTANAQPAILTTSVAILRVLQQETDIFPHMVAGHSLGEYTALVASGALRFSDAVYVVRKRGEFMQEAIPLGVGSMAAVIGLDADKVEQVCKDISKEDFWVSPANYNSSGQVVISGHSEAVEKTFPVLVEMGAKRVVPLKVSAPFHCELMRSAAMKLKEVLEGVEIFDLKIPVVTNVYAKENTDPSKVKDLLVKQVVSPVLWTSSVEYMKSKGVLRFLEIGPGNVLSGLIKRIIKGGVVSNLEKLTQLKNIKENGI